MLPALLALQALTLLLLAVVLLRRPAVTVPDSRMEALLGADLPAILARSEARADGIERFLRAEIAQLRQESVEAAERQHQRTAIGAEGLRAELLHTLGALGEALRSTAESTRGEHRAEAERLRTGLDGQLQALQHRLQTFTSEANRGQVESREALHTRLNELAKVQTEH